jgi:ABC-type uncharacterized transport system permease subunit
MYEVLFTLTLTYLARTILREKWTRVVCALFVCCAVHTLLCCCSAKRSYNTGIVAVDLCFTVSSISHTSTRVIFPEINTRLQSLWKL